MAKFKARNKVIAGDYLDATSIGAPLGKVVMVFSGIRNGIILDKTTVSHCKLLSYDSERSRTSAITRGLIGQYSSGDIGGLLGVMSAKKIFICRIEVNFRDGKKSIIEVDEKIYKTLKQTMS